MSKHTPGPWKTRRGFMPDTFEIFHPDRSIKPPFMAGDLARVEGDFGPRGEGKANARLIAAAPEMLRELQDVLGWATQERAPLRQQEIDSIARVIRKATGG